MRALWIEIFYNKHLFACVSFMRVRKKVNCPFSYIVAAFVLSHKAASPHIDIASEPYLNCWIYHLLVLQPEEIDKELMGWIKEAADFSEQK